MNSRFWPDRILPLAQLLVCIAALWPARGRVLSDLMLTARLHLVPSRTGENLPDVFPEHGLYKGAGGIGLLVPIVINSPVVLVQMPYILLNPDKMEWVPEGMSTDVWRALSWPVIGMAFWWSASRGLRALFGFRRFGPVPRLSIIEAVLAASLVICGIGATVGIATTTHDDRVDAPFMALLAGFCIWGMLGGAMLTAWILQWRARRGRKRVSAAAA